MERQQPSARLPGRARPAADSQSLRRACAWKGAAGAGGELPGVLTVGRGWGVGEWGHYEGTHQDILYSCLLQQRPMLQLPHSLLRERARWAGDGRAGLGPRGVVCHTCCV